MATQTFTYNGSTGQDGSVQNFVVPNDVTTITMECWGAQGTDEISAGHGQGGLGGYIKGDIPVSPGETLQIRVGGAPPSGLGTPGGYNGGGYAGDASGSPGGGGGASDVRRSTYTLYDRLIIGAGGGGGSYAGVGTAGTGGGGGYPTGVASSFGGSSGQAGGGTQTAGGIAGTWGGPINAGTDGIFGEGGCGWRGTHCGVGGGVVSSAGGAGGGGGKWGGGGGGDVGGGGGGSSACDGGTLITHTSATRASHGQVVFTWTPDTPVVQIEDFTEWEVKVFDSTNANPFTDLLAVVPRWTTIKFTRPLDDVGAGEIDILRDDPLWNANPALLDNQENIWAFYENGELRFTMFSEDIDENHVDDQERPVVKITGRDGAKLLQYAVVLPPSYPSYTTKNHSWAFVHAISAWFDFWDEANVRGAFPTYLQTLADQNSDSAGSGYPDINALEVPPGQDLLSLLRQWAPVSEVNWAMTPDFELVIKNTGIFGAHRGELVVFHVGNSIQELGEKRTRRDIRSHVFLEGGDGIITEVSDSSTATQWGRREIWLQSGNSKDSASGTTIANVTLAAMKNEAREITVLVRPYMTNRKVWIDYTLGDWVNIEWDALENTSAPPNQDEVKIIAISQEVDDTGNTKVEIVFNTRLQENLIRLNQIVDKFTGAGGATPAAQSSSLVTGTQIIGVSSLNDLSDVTITSPITGALLQWDGSKWIDASISAGVPPTAFGDGSDGAVTLTQSSAAPSGMSKSGSGATTLFTMNRNMYFTSLTLDDSGGNFLFTTGGWRLFVKTTLTVDAGCTIHNNGNNGSGGTGGAAPAANTVGTGTAGGNGASGAGNGVQSTGVGSLALGNRGGLAGNEAAGGGSSVGGTVVATTDPPHSFEHVLSLASYQGSTIALYRAGSGGSGGDSAASSTGGGGGGSGGICAIYASEVQNSGSITATGGVGAAATGAGTGAGGGAGGGGGAVILVYSTGATGTVTANGGAGGAGQGAGTAGGAGLNGTTWLIQV